MLQKSTDTDMVKKRAEEKEKRAKFDKKSYKNKKVKMENALSKNKQLENKIVSLNKESSR
jgi:hypothetical protein